MQLLCASIVVPWGRPEAEAARRQVGAEERGFPLAQASAAAATQLEPLESQLPQALAATASLHEQLLLRLD
eukprot:1460607-Alexandrium_andersonii.AAC.1